jgi:hypothetical protein
MLADELDADLLCVAEVKFLRGNRSGILAPMVDDALRFEARLLGPPNAQQGMSALHRREIGLSVEQFEGGFDGALTS